MNRRVLWFRRGTAGPEPGWSALRQALTALVVLCSASLSDAAIEEHAGMQITPPRLAYLQGDVSFWRPGAGDWEAAQINVPVAPGDALATRAGKLELQIGARSFLRVGDDSQVRIESQEPDFLQVRVTEGRAIVDLRDLPRGYVVQIDTPNSRALMQREGYYRIDVAGESTRLVVRRAGLAVVTPSGGHAVDVATGEGLDIEGGSVGQLTAIAAPPFDAWDRWSYERTDAFLAAPRSASVSADMYGVEELERHGTWRYTNDYGRVWVPAGTPVGWAPYTQGRWLHDPYYGWSWADYAPWGWAPFHYGRWVYAGYWAWAPGPILTTAVYAPALVAFYGGGFSVGIGVPFVSWVALGWGEPLYPWWGGYGFIGNPCWYGWGGPRYINNTVINNTTVINNYNRPDRPDFYRNEKAPGAVVSVPRDKFHNAHVNHVRVAGVETQSLKPIRGALPVAAPQRAAAAAARGAGAHAALERQARGGAAQNAMTDQGRVRPSAAFDTAAPAGPREALGAVRNRDAAAAPASRGAFDALRSREGAPAGAGQAPNIVRNTAPRRGSTPPAFRGRTASTAGVGAVETLRNRQQAAPAARALPPARRPPDMRRTAPSAERGATRAPVTDPQPGARAPSVPGSGAESPRPPDMRRSAPRAAVEAPPASASASNFSRGDAPQARTFQAPRAQARVEAMPQAGNFSRGSSGGGLGSMGGGGAARAGASGSGFGGSRALGGAGSRSR